MKTLPKIDKCPCGATARLHYRDDEDTRLHFIVCPRCGCSSYRYIDLGDAINGWNNGFFTLRWDDVKRP